MSSSRVKFDQVGPDE